MRRPRRRAEGSGRGGFTLIELLVVIAIAMTLMSLSVWAIARAAHKDELEATVNAVKALVRRAKNAAMEERSPAKVVFDADDHVVRATTRETLTLFRFEQEQLLGAPSWFPSSDDKGYFKNVPEYDVLGSLSNEGHVYGADSIKDGRLGYGLEFGRPGAYVSVKHRAMLNPIEGVAIEVWVCPFALEDVIPKSTSERRSDPDPRSKKRIMDAGAPPTPTPIRARDAWFRHPDDPPLFTCVRKGKSFELAVTAGYGVQVAVSGPSTGGTGADVTFVGRTIDRILRPHKWARLQLAFDGRQATCAVDGIQKSLDSPKGFEVLPKQLARDTSPVVFSDPDADRCFYGQMDEVKLQGIISGEHVTIPKDVVMMATPSVVSFDPLGQLDPLRHAQPVVAYFYVLSDSDMKTLAPPADGKTRTRPKAPAAVEQANFDQEKEERMAALVKTLSPANVRTVTIELTGAVGAVR